MTGLIGGLDLGWGKEKEIEDDKMTSFGPIQLGELVLPERMKWVLDEKQVWMEMEEESKINLGFLMWDAY